MVGGCVMFLNKIENKNAETLQYANGSFLDLNNIADETLTDLRIKTLPISKLRVYELPGFHRKPVGAGVPTAEIVTQKPKDTPPLGIFWEYIHQQSVELSFDQFDEKAIVPVKIALPAFSRIMQRYEILCS